MATRKKVKRYWHELSDFEQDSISFAQLFGFIGHEIVLSKKWAAAEKQRDYRREKSMRPVSVHRTFRGSAGNGSGGSGYWTGT